MIDSFHTTVYSLIRQIEGNLLWHQLKERRILGLSEA